jgi:hypothetical protein
MKQPKQPTIYNDQKHPPYFAHPGWLNSQLSIARHYGGMTLDGVRYEVDELSGDLCRLDVAKARLAAYTPAAKAVIKARHLTTPAA